MLTCTGPARTGTEGNGAQPVLDGLGGGAEGYGARFVPYGLMGGGMLEPEARRATAAAMTTASSLGLAAGDAIVLQNSNKLILRLLPCDVLARVTPTAEQVADLEVDLARRLTEGGAPVAALASGVEPRPYEHDGFVLTLWTHYEPAARQVTPPAYADALHRLHLGLRGLDVPVPHFTHRVEQAQRLVADPGRTPELTAADRDLLARTLDDTTRTILAASRPDQPLHGEPHPGNVLATPEGPLFIDFETCCRGPVEFDLAHAPEDVACHYPGADADVLRQCRLLVLAMITTWRWDRDDQLPDGRRLGTEWLARLRAESP